MTLQEIKRYIQFMESTEKPFDEAMEAWVAYIESLKLNCDPQFQNLMLAIREYKDARLKKWEEEAWTKLYLTN